MLMYERLHQTLQLNTSNAAAVHGYCGTRKDTDLPVNMPNCQQLFRGVPHLSACIAKCRQCADCRHISFSSRNDDCSLYRSCDLSSVARGHGYSSVEVRRKGELETVPTDDMPPNQAPKRKGARGSG